MRPRRRVDRAGLACLAAWIACAAPASTHHSLAGQFDESKSITLTGVIQRVDWVNPHPYLYLHVKEGTGTITWALSMVPIPVLRAAGLTREALFGTSGETVVVTALPPLDKTKRVGWMTKITYADGHFYAVSGR